MQSLFISSLILLKKKLLVGSMDIHQSHWLLLTLSTLSHVSNAASRIHYWKQKPLTLYNIVEIYSSSFLNTHHFAAACLVIKSLCDLAFCKMLIVNCRRLTLDTFFISTRFIVIIRNRICNLEVRESSKCSKKGMMASAYSAH